MKIQTIPIGAFNPRMAIKSRYALKGKNINKKYYSTNIITGSNITGKSGGAGYIFAPYIISEITSEVCYDSYMNRLIQEHRETKLKDLLD